MAALLLNDAGQISNSGLLFLWRNPKHQFDLTGQLSKIKLPTLVISGSEDKMTLAKYGRFLANDIPNAKYHCLAGVGHYIMLEQPAEVAVLMERFLEKVSSKR